MKPVTYDYNWMVRGKKIKEQQFQSQNVPFGQDKCSICLDSFEDGELISVLYCHHIFHVGCVKSWIDRKTDKSQLCPVCNHPIQTKPDNVNVVHSAVDQTDTETADLNESRVELTALETRLEGWEAQVDTNGEELKANEERKAD